jgi:hypothetical protein
MGICRLPGCYLVTNGYSIYCGTHKRCNRRHGHPQQKSITLYTLRPYMKRVAARMEKNSSNPTWVILGDRWQALVASARAASAEYRSGVVFTRNEREAWDNIAKVSNCADASQVITAVLAIYLMRDDSPHRFKSEAAFERQLVRRFRALAPHYAGEYYDLHTGKTKRVYRDTRPRTAVILAGLLKETFAVAGLMVSRLEQREVNRLLDDQQALQEALNALA